MKRSEYLKRVEAFGFAVDHMIFARALLTMAEYFFVYGEDKDKELADETRRRLLQINQTGVTD